MNENKKEMTKCHWAYCIYSQITISIACFFQQVRFAVSYLMFQVAAYFHGFYILQTRYFTSF